MSSKDFPNNKLDSLNGCEICKNFHEFDLPEHLIQEILSNNVVLFAGSGISTEDRRVFPYTFYEDIRRELGMPEAEDISFSELMTRYCTQPNGRANLLRKIRGRINYIQTFPELYRIATRFHCELSTLFFIQSIIATNWDEYFEHECGAISFSTPEDFAFWSIPDRKVFKIHGSISNFGSIVATTEDYNKCYERLEKGVLGSSLKMMLATKTILYVGYSFRDEDFIRIHSILRNEMKELLPHGFIVTLDKDSGKKYIELGLTPIFTDGTSFISVLKRHLIHDGHMLSDDIFEKIPEQLCIVNEAHHLLFDEFDITESPDILYTASYQDGLIHAYERILSVKKTGYYSKESNIIGSHDIYVEMRKERIKLKKYQDVAYIDGYINGLLFLIADEELRENLPIYYIYGCKEEPRTLEEFSEMRKNAFNYHRSAYKYAIHIIEEKGCNKEMIFHHTPFLL